MQWYYESSVAEHLGLTRNALEEYRARELKKKGDWKKIGRAVALSDAGLKKLLTYLEVGELDCSSCVVGKNGAEPDPESVELKVARVYPNPRLLLAATETGELVRVSVPNNVNFRKGMTIKARPFKGPFLNPQLYRLEGRCPRFPGKW
jgi:hypothetical protein